MNLLSRLAQRTLEAGPTVRPVTPPVFAWKEIATAHSRAPSPLPTFEEETAGLPAPPARRHVGHSARMEEPGGVRIAPGLLAERHEIAATPPLHERTIEAEGPESSAPARTTITRKVEAETRADFAPQTVHSAVSRPATIRAPQPLEPLAELRPGHVAVPVGHPEPATLRESAAKTGVVASPPSVTAITSVPAARAPTALRNERTSSETVVQISIGRVEVRGIVPETPMAPIVSRETSSALSLAEYLKQRDGGAR